MCVCYGMGLSEYEHDELEECPAADRVAQVNAYMEELCADDEEQPVEPQEEEAEEYSSFTVDY